MKKEEAEKSALEDANKERAQSFVVRFFTKKKKVELPEEEKDPSDFSIVPEPEVSQEEAMSTNQNPFLKNHFFGRMTEFRTYKEAGIDVHSFNKDFFYYHKRL